MFFWLVVCLKCPQDAFQQRIGETYRITDRYGAEKVTLFNPETHGVGVSLPAANGCSDKREPSQPRNELETLSATDRHRSRRWPKLRRISWRESIQPSAASPGRSVPTPAAANLLSSGAT